MKVVPMNDDLLISTKFSADYARFFHAESLNVLMSMEVAMKRAVETFLTLTNPFNVFAFQVYDDFYSCEVTVIINPMDTKLSKLVFKIKPLVEKRLYNLTKDLSEKVLTIEFAVAKVGLKVKQFMLANDSYWIHTDDEKILFGNFATVRSELLRPLLDNTKTILNSSNDKFESIERSINAYYLYQSPAFPSLKKAFSKDFLKVLRSNEEEWFGYRNKVEEKQHLLAAVDPLNPDEYGLNVLSMVMGIEYPDFLKWHFQKLATSQ